MDMAWTLLGRLWMLWVWVRYLLFQASKRAGNLTSRILGTGDVCLELLDAEGRVVALRHGQNVVTSWLAADPTSEATSGRDIMRRLLIPTTMPGSLRGLADASIQQLKLGTGTTAELSSDTGLAHEMPGSLKTLSSVSLSESVSSVTFVFEYGTSEVNGDISEAVLLTGSSRNDVFARKTFPTFTKTSDFTLRVRWTIRF